MTSEEFTNTYWRYAYRACAKYGYNPTFLLAQAAMESGWSNERHTRTKALAGITTGSDWQGEVYTTGKMKFRVYPNFWDSFADHARLFYEEYPTVSKTLQNGTIQDFANAVAYSKYIYEGNGDNRPAYEAGIISCHRKIVQYRPTIEFLDIENAAMLGILVATTFTVYKFL
jgi:flagellar protein FlgJ